MSLRLCIWNMEDIPIPALWEMNRNRNPETTTIPCFKNYVQCVTTRCAVLYCMYYVSDHAARVYILAWCDVPLVVGETGSRLLLGGTNSDRDVVYLASGNAPVVWERGIFMSSRITQRFTFRVSAGYVNGVIARWMSSTDVNVIWRDANGCLSTSFVASQ